MHNSTHSGNHHPVKRERHNSHLDCKPELSKVQEGRKTRGESGEEEVLLAHKHSKGAHEKSFDEIGCQFSV